ncbi:STAS domain-containing protein [Azospirillum isscasi]|uniref:STAS domain-containing protein n=1 Tax=Azospirillum isscasi TaxID=3053926 RepID=A0ABU0WRN9_9PROT|nr:STAS domain-containing protein [Azospirillum isscasi]MDQ2106492.1 STAS domain-containing protein [Azospirillum isscasi]
MRPTSSQGSVTMRLFAMPQGGCGLCAALHGRIDHAALPAMKPLLHSVAGALGLTLCIDMARVEFLDSCGIGLLLAVRNAVLGGGGSIRFENHPARIRRVLEHSRLTALIPPPCPPRCCPAIPVAA